MKKVIMLVCAMFAMVTLTMISTSASAQSKAKKTVSVEGKAVAKSRGANPNIKTDAPTVDKPVAKSRGAACSVDFYNTTGLYVKVYVDGDYKGTLAPYSSGNVTVGSGYTTIYCISAGGTREWNASGTCSTDYTYTLR